MTDLFGHVDPATEPPDGEKGQEERGAFYTPDALALAICRSVAGVHYFGRAPHVFEPGCGGGAFLRGIREVLPRCHLLGVDLLPACDGPGLVQQRDLFDVTRGSDGFDLIIGNPDFGIAERVVRHCMGLLAHGGRLALLLRLGFLASQERMGLFSEFPLYAFQSIPERPSFTGGGTDRYDYALYIWKQGHRDEGRLLRPLEWKA